MVCYLIYFLASWGRLPSAGGECRKPGVGLAGGVRAARKKADKCFHGVNSSNNIGFSELFSEICSTIPHGSVEYCKTFRNFVVLSGGTAQCYKEVFSFILEWKIWKILRRQEWARKTLLSVSRSCIHDTYWSVWGIVYLSTGIPEPPFR